MNTHRNDTGRTVGTIIAAVAAILSVGLLGYLIWSYVVQTPPSTSGDVTPSSDIRTGTVDKSLLGIE